MARKRSDDFRQLASALESFFKIKRIKKILRDAADSYPDVQSVYISFKDIELHNLEHHLLENPTLFFMEAEKAMSNVLPFQFDPNSDEKAHLTLRIIDIPTRPGLQCQVRHLTSKLIGKLVCVDGMVRRVSETRPLLVVGAFMCERCSTITYIHQHGDSKRVEPLACDQENGGCGSNAARTRFKLLTELPPHLEKIVGAKESAILSEFVDTQTLEIQELHEDLRGGEEPKRLRAIMKKDLINSIMPGNRVSLLGIIKSSQKNSSSSSKSNFFSFYMEIMSVHVIDTAYEEIEITDQDEAEILALAKDPGLKEKIASSIAPEIFGLTTEKQAIALQLFGGVRKITPSGIKIRGDIHILLVGDPGIAKSQLLGFVAQLSPRGIFASGKSSSAAGLTAAAVKESSDLTGDSRWILEAGALVLADMGAACIDEMDKMSDRDRDSMHHAMEQQEIPVHKAGISAVLQSRCAVLAAANPKLGRYDPHKYLPDQINLDPPLLTRFDVIFTMTDKVDENIDRLIATHIVETHFIGEADKSGSDQYNEHLARLEGKRGTPLDRDFLRKYIAYAKKTVFPVMTQEIMDRLVDHYVSTRRRTEGSAAPLSPRNIEALIRLTEASARMHLRERPTEADCTHAIDIMMKFLEQVARNEDGIIDTDILMTGYSGSQRDRIWTLLDLIKDIQGTDGAALEDIKRLAEERGLPPSRLEDDLKKLKREGRLFEKGENRLKVS